MKSKENLINDILFISHQLNHLHSVTVSVSFKVGSLYENKKNNGISHFVEHLFFRKLKNWNQKTLYYEMQKIGTEIHANTSYDYVSFSCTVVPMYFYNAIKILVKFLEDFKWTNIDVSEEKRVVLSQIENKSFYFDDYLIGTKYELPIIGTIESVSSLDADSVNYWKKKYFNCNNACVVVTGNFTKNQISICKNIFAAISNKGNSQPSILSIPVNFNRRNIDNRYIFYNSNSNLCNIEVFFDINNCYSYEKTRLLTSILCEGYGSKLAYSLREAHGFTDDVFSELTCFYNFSRLCISFTVKEDILLECLELFFTEIEKIKTEIKTEEYETTINFFTTNQTIDLDNTIKLNHNYILCDFVLNLMNLEPLEQKKIFESISINDIQIYAQEIFTSNNLSLIIETNLDKKLIVSHIETFMKI